MPRGDSRIRLGGGVRQRTVRGSTDFIGIPIPKREETGEESVSSLLPSLLCYGFLRANFICTTTRARSKIFNIFWNSLNKSGLSFFGELPTAFNRSQAEGVSGSIIKFIPTLFGQTSSRRPVMETPIPISMAIFSLLSHSKIGYINPSERKRFTTPTVEALRSIV